MANEFIIRKGYKSLAASEVTGSLKTTGNIIGAASGYLQRLYIQDKKALDSSSNFLYIDPNTEFGSGIYINNAVRIDGGLLGSYNEDLQLRTGTTTRITIANADGAVRFHNYGAGYLKTDSSGNITVDTSTVEDTLQSVTDRGASTTNAITINKSSESTYFTGGSGGVRQLSITTGTNTSAHALHTFNIASTNGKYEFDVNGTTEFSLDSSAATFAGIIKAANGSATAPSIAFSSDTDNGMYLEDYDAVNNKDQVSISTDGTRRFRANEAGVWSDQNIYVSGQWRKLADDWWDATHGVSGRGFRFRNTTDGTTPLSITSTGNGTFAGQIITTQNQITTNIGTTSAIRLKPGSTTNTTGKSSIFLGTSPVDNYGISLRGARLGSDGTPTFELATHFNSANGTVALSIDNSQNATFAGDLTVAGTVTAQEFHAEFVSSSIIYESGSTKFGDTSNDNHDFTGSLIVNRDPGSSQGNVMVIQNTGDYGSSQDLIIKNTFDRDVGIRFQTGGGDYYQWLDSNGDDSLVFTAAGTNRTNDATLILKQDHSVIIPNGQLTINTINQAASDTDKFLVSDSGAIKYRSGSQVLSDIGAAASSHNHDDRYFTETESDGRYLRLTGGTMSGAIDFHQTDTEDIIITGNASATNADQFFLKHNFGNVDIGNLRGNINFTSGSANFTNNATFNSDILVAEYVKHAGDTDTHLRFSGADDIRLVAGGRNVIHMAEGTDPDKVILGDSTTSTYTLGKIGIGTNNPTEKLDVNGDARFRGVIEGDEASTLIKDVITDQTYEGTAFYNPETINAFAGADKWATVTISNAYASNRTTAITDVGSAPFMVGGSTFQPYFDTSETEIVIEIDHTAEPLRYHGIIGIQFTNVGWRAERVKIEGYNGTSWTTGLDTTTNAHGTVAAKLGLGSAGVQKTKITLGNPANSGGGYMRISKIFGYDYKGVSSYDAVKTGTYYLEKFVDNGHYGNIYPAVDSTYNLGTSDLRYANIYADTLHGSVTTATTASNAMLLDGIDSTAFLRSNVDDTMTGVLTFSKENASPSITFHNGGNDMGTNAALAEIDFTADYQGSPIAYGSIQVKTNASSVRTDMDFVVKSTSGNQETALKLQGGAGKPKSFFYNDMSVEGQVSASSFIGDGSGLDNITVTTASYANNADTLDSINSTQFLRSDDADTATGLLTLNGGVHILSGTGGGKLRIKRNVGSNDGDDITDIHMDDGGIYFDVDNDNDGDSGNVTFRYKAGGSFTNSLAFTNSVISYKGNTIWHAGNDGPTSGLAAQTAATASHYTGTNLSIGGDGTTPLFDMLFTDHASGGGWDTRIQIGVSDDFEAGTGVFPTYVPAGAYGMQIQSNSDGVFFGMEEYTSGHFRPVIQWGDDDDDTPFRIKHENGSELEVSYNGDVTTTGDLTVNGGNIAVNNNNGGIQFNDANSYWLRTATNWGIYWNTSNNQLQFHNAGSTKAFIDLDTGRIDTEEHVIANGSVYANGTGFVFGTSTSEGEYITRSGNDIQFVAGGSTRMTIDGDDTRVGIGTSSTSAVLQLYKAHGTAEFVTLSNSTSAGRIQIGFQQNDTDGMHHRALITSEKDSNGTYGGRLDFKVREHSTANYETALTLRSDQSVGIGTTDPTARLTVEGSGSTVFDVQGSQGQLFSITDDLTGDLFSVSDISGIPILNVNASGDSYFDSNLDISGSLNVTGSAFFNGAIGNSPAETPGVHIGISDGDDGQIQIMGASAHVDFANAASEDYDMRIILQSNDELGILGGNLDLNGNHIVGVNDIYVGDQIIHDGDTNTYTQFHAADQWRVVTGGGERLEVNNTNTTVANTLITTGGIRLRSGAADQTATGDTTSTPSTTVAEIMKFEGNSYTNGQYTTELVKIDRGGNLPLYFRQSKSTANSFSNLIRIGDHSNNSEIFQVFGSTKIDGDLTVGKSDTDTRLRIQKADDNVSDHLQFYVGATRVGEIGGEDTTWLRINQETAKNIYTPRYIRADGGLFVDSTSYGIDGNGRLTNASLSGTYTNSLTFSGGITLSGYVQSNLKQYQSTNWRKNFFVRSVGVSGADIGDKWVHLLTVTNSTSYAKFKVKFKIDGYDDVTSGHECITAMYENHNTGQEAHSMWWSDRDGMSNAFSSVTSIRTAASGLTNTYQIWVKMAGDWRDTFTVEAEWWSSAGTTPTFPTSNGQATQPTGGTGNDITRDSRELVLNSSMDLNGNLEANGNIDAYNFRDRDNTSYSLTPSSGGTGYWQVNTPSGYLRIGPQNSSWSHFYTDRGGYYFNTKVIVDGGTIGSYNQDLSLVRANGTADRILIRDTSIGFFLDSAEDMRLENDGDLHVESDIIAYSTTISDSRLKDDVITIGGALDKVKKLRGVEYTWNRGGRKDQRDLGLIAQEVEQVIPEIVREKKMPLMDDSDTKYKTVDYEKLTAVLIEGMKEQQQQIDELKAIVSKLQNEK